MYASELRFAVFPRRCHRNRVRQTAGLRGFERSVLGERAAKHGVDARELGVGEVRLGLEGRSRDAVQDVALVLPATRPPL